MNILYFSMSGNTRAFIRSLTAYAEKAHEEDEKAPLIHATEISDQTPPAQETEPFAAFVPTYLDGGNGLDNGTDEIITNALGEYIEFGTNAAQCVGIVGSGNKNFNWQYCLTAKQYAEKFAVPVLADYELRGTPADTKRIYQILRETFKV